MAKGKQVIGFIFLAGLIGLIAYENHNDEENSAPRSQSDAASQEPSNEAAPRDNQAATSNDEDGGLPVAPFPSGIDRKNNVPIFEATVDDLKTAYNNALQADVAAAKGSAKTGISVCKKKGDEYACNFHDQAFQSTISELKKLNLVNGHFSYKASVEFGISPSGKVTSVIINGDRSDPANLLSFDANVIDFASIWDKQAGQPDNLKKYNDTLGLMRGDDAADIGQERIDIEPYAEIRCLAWPSSENNKVSCVFLPRS